MSRYIDAEKLLVELNLAENNAYEIHKYARSNGISEAILIVKDFPTADVVSEAVVEQIKWERDTAIQQLAEYGIGFGEKADAVKVVRCKDCKLFQLDRNIAPNLGTCNFVEMVRNIRDYCSRAERKEE